MTTQRSGYSKIAILLHWAIAAAILFQLGLGWRMAGEKGPAAFAAFQLHKSIGITILLLSLLRLGWRLLHRAPSHAGQPAWERAAATATHALLYAIMIGLPLTGWIIVSTSDIDIPTLLYRTIPWPHVPGLHGLPAAPKQAWNQAAHVGHEALVWTTLALLALHLGAVAKHQWLDRDAIFANMAPGARPGWREPRLWIAAVLALVALAAGRGLLAGRAQPAAAPIAAQAPVPAPAAPAAIAAPIATRVPASAPAPAPAAAPAAGGQPVRWIVAPAASTLGFAAAWAGQPIDGRFARWDGEIRFAPDALAASRIRIAVDIASATTGDAQRDGSLATPDWFDAAAHPRATFTADRIVATGPGRYRALGSLELRGIARPLALDFTVRIRGDAATASGSATIDRTIFGVGQGQWAATDQVAAAVRIHFTLAAKRG